jgi:phosphopantothenoylcysteine synthetase/decarboxylase
MRVLYVIFCGSPAASLVPGLVRAAIDRGWMVCAIATPQGTKFADLPQLESLTGYPVRSEYKYPAEPDVLPRADAVVAFPATFNTLNKWALGISDTLAVGLLCEYTGLRMPVVAVPSVTVGAGLDTHPAFQRSLALLREYGVRVIHDPERFGPGNAAPPDVVLEAVNGEVRRAPRSPR